MAPCITILEIGFGIDSRLPEFVIRQQVSASRVDIAKCELLSLQVSERIYRRAGTGDEDRVILQVSGALDQRNDSVLGASPDIYQRTQAREIVRPICKGVNGCAVIVGRCDNYRSSHCLREISLQGCSVFLIRPVYDHTDGDRPLGSIK